jgi:hypothetical protein
MKIAPFSLVPWHKKRRSHHRDRPTDRKGNAARHGHRSSLPSDLTKEYQRSPQDARGNVIFSLFPDAGTLGLTFFARHDKLVR